MKYMGSKNRIAKEILPIILEHADKMVWYIEPFVGGCNTIDKITDKSLRLLGNDSNCYLIEMLKALKNGWTPPDISHTEYKKIQNNRDEYEKALVGWVGLMCSYSGKWFGGYAGKTKTKIGTTRDYQKEALVNVKKQIPNINRVNFICMDYSRMVIPPQSIIYCDPPYKNTTKYKDGFNHDNFWNWVRMNSKNGNYVYVSEYSAPKDFKCVWQKVIKSSLSANGNIGGNKNSTERLFILT